MTPSSNRNVAPGLARLPGLTSAVQRFSPDFFDEQQLDFRFPRPDARGNDLGIVEHQQISRAKVAAQVAEHVVANLTGRAVHHHHAGGGPVGQRLLGDQLRRQQVIEFRRLHGERGVFARWLRLTVSPADGTAA